MPPNPFDSEDWVSGLPGSWRIAKKEHCVLLLANDQAPETLQIVIWPSPDPMSSGEQAEMLDVYFEGLLDVEMQYERQHDELGGYDELSEPETVTEGERKFVRLTSSCEDPERRIENRVYIGPSRLTDTSFQAFGMDGASFARRAKQVLESVQVRG